jgi:hypothetical protein
MEALLFHLGRGPATICVFVIGSIPLIGAVRTKQWSLTAGLVAGLVVSMAVYLAVR